MCFQETAWLRSRRFLLHPFIQRDKPNTVVLDVHMLSAFAASPVRRLRINRFCQLSLDMRGRFGNSFRCSRLLL